MSTNGARAAIYLRVSRDDQTTENQRLVLAKVAEHRGWLIVQTYEDQGISGAKGRDQRPAFDTMLKDAVRRQFDVLMVWSIDRLGRSVLHVANALAELDVAGVALYSDQQAIDSTTPMGRAMIRWHRCSASRSGRSFVAGSFCRSRPRAPAREEARSPEGLTAD
jgi:DNA invertase Pin-like site-specific DNA recombinase